MLRWFCCVVALGLANTAQADDAKDPRKLGVTDLAQVDEDFALQGEYAGVLCLQGQSQQVGLQVVAGGNGVFEALLYPGGLPGNGFSGAPRTRLAGQRGESSLTLTADGLTMALPPGGPVTVTDSRGQRLGELQRWERYSSTTGAAPPAGAIVLFNGTDTGELQNLKLTADGLMGIGAETKRVWTDFHLHAEFRTPYMPHARGQARGNSGFYLQRRYEVQVLDSFGLEPEFNHAGALYRTKSPDLNMSFPPLSWQTYDIHFTTARFDAGGQKVAPARITVWHNGVPVQSGFEIPNKTGGGKPEGPEPLPILFQDHGNAVQFRNVWIVDQSTATTTTCAVQSCDPCQMRPVRRQRMARHW